MKKYLIILMLLMSYGALADDTPEKFKNPIFNYKMELQGPSWRDYKITPTYIKDMKMPEYSQKCEFITQDEKAIFLKCQGVAERYKLKYYKFYFVKYRAGDLCTIWNCSFLYYKNEIQRPSISVLASNAADCEDEIDEHEYAKKHGYERDNGYGKLPRPDCLQELRARGWEKYLPGAQEYFDQIPELKE